MTNNNEKRLEELQAEIERLTSENAKLKKKLLLAKNPEPIKRPTFNRLQKLAADACLTVKRLTKEVKTFFVPHFWKGEEMVEGGRKTLIRTLGFEVSLGEAKRIFKTLTEAWEFLSQEDWSLSDLFTPDETPKRPKGCCKHCGHPIKWDKTFNPITWVFEKFIPLNPDGSLHKCREFRESFSTGEAMPMPSG